MKNRLIAAFLFTISLTAQKKDIVTVAVEAGLVETLKGEGPFTVFVPTDEVY